MKRYLTLCVHLFTAADVLLLVLAPARYCLVDDLVTFISLCVLYVCRSVCGH